MKCSKCGKELNTKSAYCTYCGSKIEETLECPNCHKEVSISEKYCTYCGYNLKEKVEDESLTKSINKETISVNQNEYTEQIDSKKNKKPLIIGVSVAVVLIIAVIVVVFVIKPFDSKSSSSENITEVSKSDGNSTENSVSGSSESTTEGKTISGSVSKSSDSNTTSGNVNKTSDSSKSGTVEKTSYVGVYIMEADSVRIRSCADDSCSIVQYNDLPNNIKSIATKKQSGNAYIEKGAVVNVLEIQTSGDSTWAKLGDGLYVCASQGNEVYLKKQ